MQTPKRLDYAHQLAPERYIGSPVIRWSSWLILGRNRDGVGRAVFVLCLLSLFIFPAFYMAAHKYETGDRSYSVAIEDISRRCIDGSGQIEPAAIYASVRNALFLIPDSDELSAKVDGCLYGKKSKTLVASWFALAPLMQAVLSGIILFAIGLAVSRRLG
jgi:hypothetical protein